MNTSRENFRFGLEIEDGDERRGIHDHFGRPFSS